MVIEKKLINELKKVNGNLLVIGSFSDKIIDTIENNKKIIFCDILTNNSFSDNWGETNSKNTYLKASEIKKKYKKKNINYVVCDFNDINNCFPIFFKDIFSIYHKKLYLSINKDSNIELTKKLDKMGVNYQILEDKDKLLYIIDSKKISFLKANLIYIENKFEIIVDMISNIIEGS